MPVSAATYTLCRPTHLQRVPALSSQARHPTSCKAGEQGAAGGAQVFGCPPGCTPAHMQPCKATCKRAACNETTAQAPSSLQHPITTKHNQPLTARTRLTLQHALVQARQQQTLCPLTPPNLLTTAKRDPSAHACGPGARGTQGRAPDILPTPTARTRHKLAPSNDARRLLPKHSRSAQAQDQPSSTMQEHSTHVQATAQQQAGPTCLPPLNLLLKARSTLQLGNHAEAVCTQRVSSCCCCLAAVLA